MGTITFAKVKKLLKPEHIYKGIEKLDKKRWPARRNSRDYDLYYEHGVRKLYPPKEVIRAATKIATGKKIVERGFSGGVGQANKPLEELGFDIRPKSEITDNNKVMREDAIPQDKTSITSKAMYEKNELQEIEPEDRKVIEGDFIERKVMVRKRNKGRADQRKQKDGHTCQACGFNYDKAIVECHHLRPMAHNKSSNITVELKDLITLCPTCHKLAHHLISNYGNEYTKKNTLIKELKEIYSNI